jgi:hypothetical protein
LTTPGLSPRIIACPRKEAQTTSQSNTIQEQTTDERTDRADRRDPEVLGELGPDLQRQKESGKEVGQKEGRPQSREKVAQGQTGGQTEGEEGKEEIKDARYVTVQLPEEIAADSRGTTGGTSGEQQTRTRSKVPVSNVPLPAHIPDTPTEKQQIPLEYRGIIR